MAPQAILSALLLPSATTILIADLAYLRWPVFYWRLACYIGLISLLCWYYRSRLLAALRRLTRGLAPRFAYPWRAWLPLAAVAVEVVSQVLRLTYGLLVAPAQTTRGLLHALQLLPDWLRQLWQRRAGRA